MKAQRVVLRLWHTSPHIVEPKAKRLKGVIKRLGFYITIIIFQTSELTYSGKADFKSNTAMSLDTLLLFVKTQEHPKRSGR